MFGHRSPGFALVTVLWVLALVGIAASAIHLAAAVERRSVANKRDASVQRWAALGALAWSLDSMDRALKGGLPGEEWRARGDTLLPPIDFALPSGVGARAVLRDARARLDINTAGVAQLRRLFQVLALDGPSGSAVIEGILAARAEAEEGMPPPGLRRSHELRPGPFTDVADLWAIREMSRELYGRLGPFVTTFGDGRVNVNTAAPEVLMTLPGVDAVAAQAVVQRRGRAPFHDPFSVLALLSPSARADVTRNIGEFVQRVAFTPRHIEAVAIGSAPGSVIQVEVTAVIELQGGVTWRLVRTVERLADP